MCGHCGSGTEDAEQGQMEPSLATRPGLPGRQARLRPGLPASRLSGGARGLFWGVCTFSWSLKPSREDGATWVAWQTPGSWNGRSVGAGGTSQLQLPLSRVP